MLVAVNLLAAQYFGTFTSQESSEDFTTKGSNIKFVQIAYLQPIQIRWFLFLIDDRKKKKEIKSLR